LNPVTLTSLSTQEGAIEKENTITVADYFVAVKTLKTGKAADCDEIRPEILKTLNREVPWLDRVCQMAWCFGRAEKH